MKKKGTIMTVASAATVLALASFAAASCEERKDVSQKSSEATVVTNSNGSVSRAYTESTVTTNGSMVTERRRETRTTFDADGNMLESSTSEYAQSYTVGDESPMPSPAADRKDDARVAAPAADSFLGVKFGEEFKGTNFVADLDERDLLCATFVPKKPLEGFDDYYVYVTPTSHRVVKICACAKEAVDPGVDGRRHYLIEALEKRYQTWARLRSWCRPLYTFDIGSGRYVTAILYGASRSYETVLSAWDEALLGVAAEEAEALRVEALKNAAEKRKTKVVDATSAF